MDTNLQVAALKYVLTFTSSFILSKPLEGCSLFMEISEVFFFLQTMMSNNPKILLK